jgi:chaperonin GroES
MALLWDSYRAPYGKAIGKFDVVCGPGGLALTAAAIGTYIWHSPRESARVSPDPVGKETFRMNVRPLHDRLIVQRIEEKETVKGGIIIPDTAKEKPQEGKVIAVGNGKILENGTKVPLDVKAGDKILFGKYSGTDIKIDGKEYLILREDEVLAIVG